MCAILDNNVRHEVFGDRDAQTPAGKYFLDWVESSSGRLVIGGELRRELSGYGRFLTWMRTATRRNVVRSIDDKQVDDETRNLRGQGNCRSDDEHVLALARISGARLLFTNDQDLQDDFRDPGIVGGTRGRIYTTREYSDVRRSHRELLRRTDLCSG